MFKLWCAVGLPALMLAGCSVDDQLAPSEPSGSSELIYGTDDRMEWYEISDPDLLALGDATAMLVSPGWLSSYPNGDVGIDVSYTLRDYQGVCTSEPYWNQPVPGDCTGFLVGDDLAVTAGHCVSNSSCSTTWFVFGFRMDGPGDVRERVSEDDVYVCAEVVARQSTTTRDYAVVRLDRDVVGREPMALRRSGTVASGTPLLVSSHPVGLPLKISDNATVRSNSSSYYFEANLDVYGGSSGAPVINANTLEVEGILVRGNDDWDWSGGCYVSNVCPDSGCPSWEEVTRTSLFESFVPDPGTVTPSCADDALEPNDAQAQALPIGAGEIADLAVCDGADDWFAVQVGAGDTLSVVALFSHAAGDVDLAVYDGSGIRLALSESASDNEGVQLVATASGTLFVRVYGYQGAENSYTLQVDVDPVGAVGVTLSGDPVATAGGSYTWYGSGPLANDSLVVVTGAPGGATPVPGCATATVPASNLLVVTTMATDGSGQGQASRVLPTTVAGSTRTFWAVSRAACEVSAPWTVSIQ
jgi:hypothetical protein